MYRTGSSSRVFDEFFSSTTKPTSQTVDSDQELLQQQQQQLLPIYNPESPLAKKDKSRLRSAETAIHFIPLLLIVCAAILWFCSAPVDKNGFTAARVKI